MNKKLLYFLFITVNQVFFGQSTTSNVLVSLRRFDFENAYLFNKKEVNLPEKELQLLLIKIIEDDRQSQLKDIDNRLLNFKIENSLKELQLFISHLIKAYIHLNYSKNRVLSFTHLDKSYKLSQKIQDAEIKKSALYFILYFYQKGVLQKNNEYLTYLNQYKEICKTPYDYIHYYSFDYNLKVQKLINESKNSINSKNGYNFKSYDSLIKSNNLTSNVLLLYYRDKANFLLKQAPKEAEALFNIYKSYFTNSNFYVYHRFYYFTRLSKIYSLTNRDIEGLSLINKAKKYISVNDSLWDTHDINYYKAIHFFNLKHYDSAYYYKSKNQDLLFKINFQKHNQEVSEIREKLNVVEKDRLILKTESKRKQNLNLLIATLLILITGSCIYILSLKNSKRKRKLAIQQKEIEQQKNLTLLKEQEINSINAMIDGQEKERIRIAEDLHDNIGSVLSTLKLHFENLKLNRNKKHFNQEELYEKTEKLIDETYLKVRKIAHAKNSGVIANQGLLVAIKNMADKISSADKICIEVVEFGLDRRIENTIEITMFRIIQELVTNIVKHANATNASINISLFDNNLNVIVEDDGNGFVENNIKLKDGMGIKSIKTRIKHLNGIIKIDSFINKGTTIIIDIPV